MATEKHALSQLKYQVLILEQAPDRRALLEQALQAEGLPVMIRYVQDKQQILDLCAQMRQPDLILLNPPAQPDWIRELRAQPACKRTPVVMLNRDDQTDEYYRAGCNFCVRSAIEPSEYSLTLRAVFQFWFDFVALPAGAR